MPTENPHRAVTAEHTELPIEGMSCASCAVRVERRLNDLDGVCDGSGAGTSMADPNCRLTTRDQGATASVTSLLPRPAPRAPRP